MENGEEVKVRILAAAREEFYKFGFTRVTVDEIASKLGMSKKTIYKCFTSKDEILKEITRATLEEMAVCCRDIVREEGIDFVDKLKKMMTMVAVQYSKLGRPLVDDLQKNAPHIWKEIADFRTQHINNEFGSLISEGIAKGMLRSDVDQRLILMIYGNAIQTIINPEMLVNLPYSAAQVYETIIKVIFEGILTDEAKPKYLSHHPLLSVAQQRI